MGRKSSGPNVAVMVPQLETKRLILRGWRDDDLDRWCAMCDDERVMRFLSRRLDRETAIADAARLQANLERDRFGWWVLEVKGGPTFVGLVALQMIPFEAAFTPAMEVGWRLAYDAWGHGYATEGARAAIDYAFRELGRDEILAMTARINLRSQRVMERLGMQRDARDDFDNPRVAANDALRPHVLYRIGFSRDSV